MEGDLTLQLIQDAAASGLLHQLQLDVFDRKDAVLLQHILANLKRERFLRYSTRELEVSLVSKICMAVANRNQFKSTHKDMMDVLEYLRNTDFPDKQGNENKYDDLLVLWQKTFKMDPVEYEKQFFAKRAEDRRKKAAPPDQATLRKNYVKSNFLRS